MAVQKELVASLLILASSLASQGIPKIQRPSSAFSSLKNRGDILTNTLGDLIRFEFAGSVETHLVGPKHDGDTKAVDDSMQHPLVELNQPSKVIPSLYFGVDYDYGQVKRKWHGISCLLSRLRFRPTYGVAVDLSRVQVIDHDVPSSTTLMLSRKGLRSSLCATSHSSSFLLSIPVMPSRLHWDFSLSSLQKLSQGHYRSGWLVDAMGQVQGSHKFQISQDLNARCSLRRRIRWISREEGVFESTHIGLSLQHRHGDQGSTMVSFTAQLDQISDSARFRVRHDIALGGICSLSTDGQS